MTDANVAAVENIVFTVHGAATTVSASSKTTVDEIVDLLNADGTFAASNTAAVGADGNNVVISTVATTNNSNTTNTIAMVGVDLGGGSGTAVNGTVLQEGATFGIAAIDSALSSIASNRATLGALQSQLESTVRNLANVAENTAAAAGRIMDTDYAAETANLTKAQILQQAATSILAQANAQPQSVLTLLQQ